MPKTYTVSVACIFDAESPLDALSQMVAWIDDAAYRAGYRIVDEDGKATFIDADDVDWDNLSEEGHPNA